MPLRTLTFCVAVLGICAAACQTSQEPTHHLLPKDDEVLARVGDDPITRYDLDQSTRETLGTVADTVIAKGRQDTLVEGLVARKAMAKARWEEMTPKQRLAIDKKATVFRERLLAKSYIEAHATTELRPSDAQVLTYYETHADRFGAREFKTFEILIADFERKGPLREQRLKRMGELERIEGWRAIAAEPAQNGWLRWMKGDAELGTLHPKLRKKIVTMATGDDSGVMVIDDRAYIARVTGTRTRIAKPLSTVRKEIEEVLRPGAYRDAVRELRADVLGKTDVEYSRNDQL